MKRWKRWIERTVKNGTVKCYGKMYKPDDDYDGELEGLKLLFGRYQHAPRLLYLTTNSYNTEGYNYIRWMFWIQVGTPIDRSE